MVTTTLSIQPPYLMFADSKNFLVEVCIATFAFALIASVITATPRIGVVITKHGVDINAEAHRKTKENMKFTLVLKDAGDNKIAVIKAVRTLACLDLRTAKDLVDTCPHNVMEEVSKEEVEKGEKLLEEAGAVAVVVEAGGSGEAPNNTFNVVLIESGPNKVEVVKAVWKLTDTDLKIAKDMVDHCPFTIMGGVSEEKAEEAKKLLQELEAVVFLN